MLPVARLDHPSNDTQGVIPNCKVLVDTCPCKIENIANSNVAYQGKYADHVVKFCAFLSINGYFLGLGRTVLYLGTSADNVILDSELGFHQYLEDFDCSALADGGFTRSERVHTPWKKDEIWPDPVPRDRTMRAQYTADGNAKLDRNARLCFWRARVEHAFGESLMGRFALLKNYGGHSFERLCGAFILAQCVLNAESRVEKGPAGRYQVRPVTDADYAKSRIAQVGRYPEPGVAHPPTRRRREADLVPCTQPRISQWVIYQRGDPEPAAPPTDEDAPAEVDP